MYTDELSAQANLPSSPDNAVLEGYVVPGSYDPTQGTIEVLLGNTAAVFTDYGDSPTTIVANLMTVGIGMQYGPVGLERVELFRTPSGYSALIEHGPDDTPGALTGEWWWLHRNPTTETYDAGVRLLNDGPTVGDGLGTTEVGNDGAQTILKTKNGNITVVLQEFEDDETADTLTISCFGNVIELTADPSISLSVTGAAGTSQTIMNATTGSISHVVPTGAHIGIGVLAEDIALSCGANALLNIAHLSFYENGRLATALMDMIKMVTLLNTIGTMNSGQLLAALAALVGNWIHGITLPVPSCFALTPT